MTRKSENTRKSKKVIYIVCEGTRTEPQFFKSIRDRIIDGIYDIGDCEVIIIPKPIEPEELAAPKFNPKRGNYYEGKKRKVLTKDEEGDDEKDKFIIEKGYAVPLNWVKTARRNMEGAQADEAWAVFDKDGHPAMKEAFEEANTEINGKKVNIAFSSRSFEYYLLLHFEDIFEEFHATECGERMPNGNKKPFYCMHSKRKRDGGCNGDKCINGYARKKKHWEESKTAESTFTLIEDKLNIGIVHAYWLRFISEQVDCRLEYERNPYVTVDRLVCRLTNTWVTEATKECELEYTGKSLRICVLENNTLVVRNLSEQTVIIPEDFFQILNCKNASLYSLNERKYLNPKNEERYICTLTDATAIVVNGKYVGGNYIFLRNYKLDI